VRETFPQSVLFCCDHNAVRSPMAEGIMKKFYGTGTYVQSAGVHNDMEIDGFAIAVCRRLGVELERHRSRSFDEMEEWGDDLGFDLIVALSPGKPAPRAGPDAALSPRCRILADPRSHRAGRERGRPSSTPTGRPAIRSSVG
jgi:hypothetical protein